MSSGLLFLGCAIGLIVVALIIIKCIRIVPECPHCKKVGEIYNSNVRDAWLDCRCLSCQYKWRIE